MSALIAPRWLALATASSRLNYWRPRPKRRYLYGFWADPQAA